MIDFFDDSRLKEIFSHDRVAVKGLGLGEMCASLTATDEKIFFVLPSADLTSKAYEELRALGENVTVLDVADMPFVASTYESGQNRTRLIRFLHDIYRGARIAVVSADVLHVRLPHRVDFEQNIIKLAIGQDVGLLHFVKRLISMGYTRAEVVSNVGEYAVRGDIVDVFMPISEYPVRINFFDDSVEKMYYFDSATGTKNEELDDLEIVPNDVMMLDDDHKDVVKKSISLTMSKYNEHQLQEVYNNLDIRDTIPAQMLDVFSDEMTVSIADYFDADRTALAYSLQIENEIEKIQKNIDKKIDLFFNNENIKNIAKNKNKIINYCENNKKIIIFDNTQNYENYHISRHIEQKNIFFNDFLYKIELLVAETKKYINKKIILCLKEEETLTSIENIFTKMSVPSTRDMSRTGLVLTTLDIPYNICFEDSDVLYIGSVNFAHKKKTKKSTATVQKYLPAKGEYVVHSVHGIGLCEGVEKITVMGSVKDFFKIKYKNDDTLYVPIENTDCLSLYMGADGHVKLNKLGGKEFATIKKNAQKAIDDMAQELLALYSARQNAKGYVYAPDDYLMTEFEQAFPYEETADQQSAILDVKNDMMSSKIMDRLICGDVGYGKTEVALRAMFKAVLSGKQVAFLAPTTVLSLQHYMSVVDRCKNFDLNVAMLNRFKSPKQQKEILRDLKDGKVNVICGTHRLLSNDVQFADLGLLILDEEHRFGVSAKEKIKQLKNNVDVLTMSATPIPRTLNMALLSIRDISIINTPPRDRLPVKTYVMAYNEKIIAQAIRDEVARGGQVLIIYNDIDQIYGLCSSLRKAVADDSVVFDVAHGQMDKVVLENAVKRLYDKETQVFVSTTLIENGIDLPKANTLIVLNSHRLGLSQMYQLRGRVGRSTEQAYAYFTYPDRSVMTTESMKRLEILAENTELGSGFKIAMRDLQLRGAGELLGKYQHGHMVKIGYDMYVKLLNETTARLKGEKVVQARDIKIDIDISAHIPISYISDEAERLKCYAKISNITDTTSQKATLDYIKQTYGNKIPTSVRQLTIVALIKSLATKCGVKRIVLNPQKMAIEYYMEDFDFEKCLKSLKKYDKFIVRNGVCPTLELNVSKFSVQNAQDYVLNYLQNDNNY